MKKLISSLLIVCLLVITTITPTWAVGYLNDNEKELLAALKSTVKVEIKIKI